MKIETTVYLESAMIEKLTASATEKGVSRSALISSLMNRMALVYREYASPLKGVRYQERDGGAAKRRLHVCLRPGEYEMFIDERKVFKLSVSFILAVAVERFLCDMVDLIEKYGDNYRCQNYAIMHINIENVTAWVLYWGIPPRLLE